MILLANKIHESKFVINFFKPSFGIDRYRENILWPNNYFLIFTIYFPYWSTGQIRRILKSLVNYGVIIEGNYNKHKYDRTKWYALKDEKYWMTKYNPVDEIDNWENRY